MIAGLLVGTALVAVTTVVVWRVYRERHRADTTEEMDAAEWLEFMRGHIAKPPEPPPDQSPLPKRVEGED
jgi:hypothetical protein